MGQTGVENKLYHVIDKWRATAVNILRVTVNCFLFDVIVFAMLPAHAYGGKQFHC